MIMSRIAETWMVIFHLESKQASVKDSNNGSAKAPIDLDSYISFGK